MLEAIKLVGALVGLATGIFTAWDRWARGRPLAWVTAKKLGVNPIRSHQKSRSRGCIHSWRPRVPVEYLRYCQRSLS
jgi:hypothetical protein